MDETINEPTEPTDVQQPVEESIDTPVEETMETSEPETA